MESRIIEITPAAHKHGNLNILPCGLDFFPDGILGGSNRTKLGTQILIKAKGLPETIRTDIPTDCKTGRPRWLFRERAWLRHFVNMHNLVPGDGIVIRRVDNLTYTILPRKNKRQYKNIKSSFRANYKPKMLSLFSGCGGMDLGFEGDFDVLKCCVNKLIHPDWLASKRNNHWVRLRSTSFKVVFANDISPAAKKAWLPYFIKRGVKENIFRLDSIVDLVRRVSAGEKSVFPSNIDVVTGGFPCQDFSNAGKRRGFVSHRSHTGELIDNMNKPAIENRGNLYIWMRNVIEIVRPKVFIAENVKALTTLSRARQVIEDDFKSISKGGYTVLSRVLHAAEYGVPQTRERIFFYGFLSSALKTKVLKALQSREIPSELDPFPPITHRVKKLDLFNKNGKLMPVVTAGMSLKGLPEPKGSIDDESQAVYSGARYYGRHCQGNVEIDLNAPSFTIRAQHHGNIEFRRLSKEHGGIIKEELDAGLPERRLTVRECARLQTFPDDYQFVRKPKSKNDELKLCGTEGYVLVGNAVPPLLAYHLATRLEKIWPLYFKGYRK